jgi:predicted dienelactone hydrolase
MKNALTDVLFAVCLIAVLWAATVAQGQTPTYKVETISETWADAARDGREVPIKAYLPVDAQGPRPVIIFSHGLGGTRDGYGYLGEFWASHGYVSVHLQHLGSDDAVWRDARLGQRISAMRKAIKDVSNSLNRPLDVSFAIDRLEALNDETGSPWFGRLDLEHIGMAGHSYGAFTTMAIAGQAYIGRDGQSRNLADERVDAAIAMSPQAPRDKNQYDASYAEISIPLFVMTGTHDDSIVSPTTPADRRVAFDYTPGPADGGPDVYLVTFTDGDHMIFSGRPRRGFDPPAGGDDRVFQAHICKSSLAFWDAYLTGDEASRGWLRGGGFEDDLGDTGVFEVKP